MGGSLGAVETSEGQRELWFWLFPPYYWHFDARAVEQTEASFFNKPLHEQPYGLRLRCLKGSWHAGQYEYFANHHC